MTRGKEGVILTEREEIEAFAEKKLPDFYPYAELASVSTKHQNIPETAAYLAETFKSYGAAKTAIWTDCGGHPVVFAEFKGKSPKTLLFYNHYDVQPAEPLDEWHSDPFVPTVRDGKLYARGICDDKGELMSRLTVVDYFNHHGGLPVNLKFIVEGEEELGSPHVDQYVHAHAKELAADVCIWEGGGKNEEEKFQITCGMKGIFSFDMEVVTAEKDIHSSLACYADNAAWRLVKALASLRGENGRVLVDGFYDDILPIDDTMRKVLDQYHFDNETVKKANGLLGDFVTDKPKEALMCGPTITINGLSSGFEGEGTKTIIPRKARAKLDCRLVPNQDPEKMFHLIEKQLAKNGFPDVKLTFGVGEKPFRSDMNDPFVKLCTKTAKDVYGEDGIVIVPNMPGGGPGYQFVTELHVPVVLVGINYAGSGPHAPNENIRIEDYKEGTYYMVKLLEAYGKE